MKKQIFDLKSNRYSKLEIKEREMIKEYHRLYVKGTNQMKVYGVLASMFGYKNALTVNTTFTRLKKNYPEEFIK